MPLPALSRVIRLRPISYLSRIHWASPSRSYQRDYDVRSAVAHCTRSSRGDWRMCWVTAVSLAVYGLVRAIGWVIGGLPARALGSDCDDLERDSATAATFRRSSRTGPWEDRKSVV